MGQDGFPKGFAEFGDIFSYQAQLSKSSPSEDVDRSWPPKIGLWSVIQGARQKSVNKAIPNMTQYRQNPMELHYCFMLGKDCFRFLSRRSTDADRRFFKYLLTNVRIVCVLK